MGFTTYDNAFLIFNPTAGRLRRDPKLVEQTAGALRAGGTRVTLRPTTGPNMATELAAQCVEEEADLIAVLGGDGTVNEVVNGMVGSRTPLVVLPGGTANVLCMELKVGSKAVRVARQIGTWVSQRIALGKVHVPEGSRYFLLMAGTGLDAHIVYHLKPALKRMFGKLAYWEGGFASLARKLEVFDTVLPSGRVTGTSFSLVSRVRNYGGDLEIAKGANLLDDSFEAVVFEGGNPLRYLKFFGGVLAGGVKGMKGVAVERAAEVEVSAPEEGRGYVQVDGEAVGTLPARIEIVPDALSLLMPKEFQARRLVELPEEAVRSR